MVRGNKHVRGAVIVPSKADILQKYERRLIALAYIASNKNAAELVGRDGSL